MSETMPSTIRQATSALEQACQLLDIPGKQSFQESYPYLETAAEALQALCFSLSREARGRKASEEDDTLLGNMFRKGTLRREVAGIRQRVLKTKALVEGVATYYDGWMRMLGVTAGGYTRAGSASLSARGSLSTAG